MSCKLLAHVAEPAGRIAGTVHPGDDITCQLENLLADQLRCQGQVGVRQSSSQW